mgnify:CR=1 FL=1
MKKTFEGVVLDTPLEEQLQFYASSIRNTRANRAPMRHMLFYGPPGTGKTMLVRHRLHDAQLRLLHFVVPVPLCHSHILSVAWF